MKFFKNFLGLLFSGLLTMTAWGQGKSIDRIVSKVDNYIVLQSEVEALYEDMIANGMKGADRCQALQNLVVQKVLVAKAEIDSVTVDDKEVEAQLDRRMDYMVRTQFGSPEKLMEAYGKSIETLKSELRKQLREQLLSQKMRETITGTIKITPSEVKKFYNNLPKDSIPYFPTEVEVGQIVKIAKVGKEQKEEVRARLNQIRDRALKGEDFAALAKQFSADGSAQEGGLLQMSKRGEMVPEFEAAAFKLKKGEISPVIESEFGFHVIQLVERRGDEYQARHILLRPNYSAVDLQEVERTLDSLRTLIVNDSITFEKAAKLHSEDKATAPSGGMISDVNTGSTRIFTDNLEPGVYFAIDTMQVGTVSKPIVYRTDDGKSAMRILYYKTKIAPHQANLKDDWQKIYEAALNEKRARALNDWFVKAKEEVFIEIDEDFSFCRILSGMQ